MREILALVGVTAALTALGALVAYFVWPSLLADADLDTLYAVGAVAVSIPVITVLAIRERRRKRRGAARR